MAEDAMTEEVADSSFNTSLRGRRLRDRKLFLIMAEEVAVDSAPNILS